MTFPVDSQPDSSSPERMRRLDALESVPEEDFREAVRSFEQEFGRLPDDEYEELVLLRSLKKREPQQQPQQP